MDHKILKGFVLQSRGPQNDRRSGVLGHGHVIGTDLTLIDHYHYHSLGQGHFILVTQLVAEETFDARFLKLSKFNIASILLAKQQNWISEWVTCPL